MNEDIILSMVRPYLKKAELSYSDFDNIFGNLLSQHEQYEVVSILSLNGIELVDLDDIQQNYYKIAEPYAKNGYLKYDEFDKIFGKYPHKEQYKIIEELFSKGIELIDNVEEPIDIKKSDFDTLIDPLNITIDEKNTNDFEILYDEKIFHDKEKSNNTVVVNKNVKQTNEILCKLIQEGNQQAQQDICIKNQGLVQKYASAYYNYYGNDLEFEDLEQVGYIGLIIAAEKFDMKRDNAFTTYATFWIKQAMSREIFDQGFPIRIPVHAMEKIIKITRLENIFDFQRMNHKQIINSIAEELQITEDEVRHYIHIRQKFLRCASLNIPVGEDMETELGELIPDEESITAEDAAIKKSLSKDIRYVVSKLSMREQEVINLRFGLIDGRKRTLEEVGQVLNVTRERARQIEAKALRKLRHPSKSKMIKEYL